jgi:hypothetical protein
MHELVRQYAAAQLAANPDEHAAARARHSGYFLTLLQRRERDMKGTLQKAVLAELVVEADNLRPAWTGRSSRARPPRCAGHCAA